MTVDALAKNEHFTAICIPEPDRSIEGVYIGDLLSWVMGKAAPGDAWITIMSNINVIAVASLTDVSCVILSEGVTLSEEIIAKAEEKGINVLSTSLSGYSTAIVLNGMLR